MMNITKQYTMMIKDANVMKRLRLMLKNKFFRMIQVAKHTLNRKDMSHIEGGKLLTDKIIDAVQIVMKNQFRDPKTDGFQSVLNKQRVLNFKKAESNLILNSAPRKPQIRSLDHCFYLTLSGRYTKYFG